MIVQNEIDLFYDKIPHSSIVAIFGLSFLAEKIYNHLINHRKDIKVSFFINYNKKEDYMGLNTCSLDEAINVRRNEFDFVVVADYANIYVNNILDIYNIPYVSLNEFIIEYYSNKHEILNDRNYEKIINIFSDDIDKSIFDMMFKRRCKIITDDEIKKYYYKNHYKNARSLRTISAQYLDKIKKDNVRIILDLGFNSGFNSVAFNKKLPNLQKIYAFEAIYDLCRIDFVEKFIPKNKITVVNKAVSDTIGTTKFYINNNNLNASLSSSSVSVQYKDISSNYKEVEVETTTIDDFCNKNTVSFDFIKMDIEGSELSALKGGIKTIKKLRPQLAISIYHNDLDFVNIPVFLFENLENYNFKMGQYSPDINETILYAIPNEI